MFWRNLKPVPIGVAMITLGFIAIILGWNGAARFACVDCQIPYLISGAAIGLALIVVGGGLLIFEAMRRYQAHLESKLDELIAAVGGSVSQNGSAAPRTAPTPAVPAARLTNTDLVVVGRSSFHRPDCRLVEGKEGLDYAPLEQAVSGGLTPCRVCEPQTQREPQKQRARR